MIYFQAFTVESKSNFYDPYNGHFFGSLNMYTFFYLPGIVHIHIDDIHFVLFALGEQVCKEKCFL